MGRSPGAKELDKFTRGRIIGRYETGQSQRKIAKDLGVANGTVFNVISRFNRGLISPSKRSGRPPKLDLETAKRLKLAAIQNRRFFVDDLGKKFGVCPNTVRKYLKEMGYRKRVAKKKPLLTEDQRTRRFQWAEKMWKKTKKFWKRVIYSDESRFCQFSDARRVWVWRNVDETYEDDCLVPTVKKSKGVMAWAAIWFGGRSELIFVDGNVNRWKYMDMLDEGVLTLFQNKTLDKNEMIFMDDGAPAHRAFETELYKVENGINCLVWPGQSPDQNPIENLWFLLEKKLRENPVKPKSVFHLKEMLTFAFNSIDQKVIDNLFLSAPRRAKMLYNMKGGATKY